MVLKDGLTGKQADWQTGQINQGESLIPAGQPGGRFASWPPDHIPGIFPPNARIILASPPPLDMLFITFCI